MPRVKPYAILSRANINDWVLIIGLIIALELSLKSALSLVCIWMCIFVCLFPALLLNRDKSAAEKRRQLIQESKFLGGDMEHTHLVKGLDFALLQKVHPRNHCLTIKPLPHKCLCLLYCFNFRSELRSLVRSGKRRTWLRKCRRKSSMFHKFLFVHLKG